MMNDPYKKMKNLFLRQSYIDAWEDYQRSIRKKSFAQWDYIVLTASNEEQAEAFRSQIVYRQEKNVLPYSFNNIYASMPFECIKQHFAKMM